MIGSHIRRASRFFAVIVAVAFAFGFVMAWLATLGFFLIMFGVPVLLGCFVVGGIIFTAGGIKLAFRPGAVGVRIALASAAPVMMVATAGLALPVLWAGGDLGTWTRLLINQGHYEAIIAKARRGEHSPSGGSAFEQDGGVDYIVDAGPPVRVAFNPEGILDNWSGIIFDPTGKVALANCFDPVTGKFAAPNAVTKLFGGDLVKCRHLWAAYYRCSFT